jgi:hypothetical protein
LATLGFDLIASSPEEFGARIRADFEKWAKVIRAANIKAESGILVASIFHKSRSALRAWHHP